MYPTPPIDHRSMEHHYTKLLGHPDIKFYPPPIGHRSMEHHYTESLGHDDIRFYPSNQP